MFQTNAIMSRIQPSISLKFGLFFLLLLLLGAANVLVLHAALTEVKGTAATINVTGSLRWQSQRLQVNLLRVVKGLGGKHAEIEPAIERFEHTLGVLEQGGQIQGFHLDRPSPEVLATIEAVHQDWTAYRTDIRRILLTFESNDDLSYELLKLEAGSLRMLSATDAAVASLTRRFAQIEADALTHVYRLGMADLLALAIAFLAIRMRIVRPLVRLAGLSSQFSAGRFGERSAYRSGDEIGQLAASFDHMADQTERHIARINSDLEQMSQTEILLRKLSVAVEQSPNAVVIADTNGSIEYVNARFTEMTGYTQREAIGQNPRLWQSGQTPLETYRDLWGTITSGKLWRGEVLNRKKSGELYWDCTNISPIFDDNGVLAHFVAIKEDVTQRISDQKKLSHLNRTLRLLSACNQTLIHAREESELLDRVCHIIAEMGAYPQVWVGFTEEGAGQTLRTAVQVGRGAGLMEACDKLPWANGERYAGLVAAAIRNGESVVARNPAANLHLAASHGLRLAAGVSSLIAMPLISDGVILGVMSIAAHEPDSFDAAEVAVLKELADDLAFGVLGLRRAAEQRRTEDMLRLHDRAIAESINGIVISKARTDEDNPIIYANPAFTRMTGYAADEIIGCNPRILLRDDWDQPDIERLREAAREGLDARVVLRNYRKDGSLFWNEISMASVHGQDGRVSHFISIFNDVSDRIRYQSELAHQANHDALTGLANRNLLKDRIEHALIRAERNGLTAAVFFIDLDHFKYVNDSLGHAVGDQLIRAVSEQLSNCAREADTVARLGGDEFVLLFTDLQSDSHVINVLTRVLGAVSRQYQIEQHEMYVTASIGVSLYPRDGLDGDTLLRNADAAMYRAKECGRYRFEFFQDAMNASAGERLSLETSLRHALERDELRVHYQPQVDLQTGAIVGAEALVRWQHPELGLLQPGQFIPIAEETGLILSIGEWVLRNVCAQQRAWLDAGLPVCRVAVNLSARQFRQKNLVQMIEEILDAYALDAQLLEIEIVESAAMGDVNEAVSIMQQLKSRGIKISMDDFGTGYSSLSCLKRFPIDNLKIDRDFVRELTSDPDAAAICLATINLAHSLRLAVVAEGVETEGQLNYLHRHHCDVMQGYYFSRPLPPEEFARLITDGATMAVPARDAGAARRGVPALDENKIGIDGNAGYCD